MPTLLLIRHAQASYGAADYDVLSERGHRQLAALRAALDQRGVRADAVISGSLRRQRDTAAWLAGEAVRVDARWDEYDAADLLTHHSGTAARLEHPQGAPPSLSSRDFQAALDDAMLAWIAAGRRGAADETWPAFRDRVRGALEDALAGLGRGRTGLVSTSGGVIAAICASVLDVADEAFVTLNRTSVNASVTKLVAGRSGISLVSFNEHAHLEPEGLVTFR